MALRLSSTPDGEDSLVSLPDGDLASMLRTAARLVEARVESDDAVPAVLGTVAAELGVACGRLYELWDAPEGS